MAKKKTRKDLEEAYNTSIQSRQLRLWQGAVIYEIVCLLTTMKGPWKMGPLRQRLVFHQDRFTAGSELIWLHRTEEKSCCWPQVISRVLIGFSLQLLPFFLSFFSFSFFLIFILFYVPFNVGCEAVFTGRLTVESEQNAPSTSPSLFPSSLKMF